MTVRVAVIGCGAIARRTHIPAFRAAPDAEVVAFASRTRGSAEAACADLGSGEVFDDWRDAIASEDVDAVDICSPNAAHRDQAVAAADAGKHVLVEKPIACTVEEADDMIAAAERNGVVLHVAHNLRYIAPVVAARDVVRSGRLGNIVSLRAAFGHAGPKDWAPDSTWFFDRDASGGGALIDLGIHIIDLVGHVSGLTPKEVTAMTGGMGSVEDVAHLVVRFAEQAIGTIAASWVARPAPDIGFTIFGTQGTLHFDARSPLTFRSAAGESEKIELPEVSANPYVDFVRAVRGEQPLGPAATAPEARTALAVVRAAYESSSQGTTTEVAR